MIVKSTFLYCELFLLRRIACYCVAKYLNLSYHHACGKEKTFFHQQFSRNSEAFALGFLENKSVFVTGNS